MNDLNEEMLATVEAQEENPWEVLVQPLEGYIKILTNRGLVKVGLRAPNQDVVRERAEALVRPVPPTKTIKLEGAKGKSASRQIEDENDPEYLKAREEFGMLQTFVLLEEALMVKPRGDNFLARVETYKKLSAPALAIIISGIQSLMMQELTADMQEDESY